MKTHKTIFYQLWQEIIKSQTANSNNEVNDALKLLDEKAKELEGQVYCEGAFITAIEVE
jgi:hypothetical protein